MRVQTSLEPVSLTETTEDSSGSSHLRREGLVIAGEDPQEWVHFHMSTCTEIPEPLLVQFPPPPLLLPCPRSKPRSLSQPSSDTIFAPWSLLPLKCFDSHRTVSCTSYYINPVDLILLCEHVCGPYCIIYARRAEAFSGHHRLWDSITAAQMTSSWMYKWEESLLTMALTFF